MDTSVRREEHVPKIINLVLVLPLTWILNGCISELIEDVGGCKMKACAESFMKLDTEKMNK